jgi:hypothetical protein
LKTYLQLLRRGPETSPKVRSYLRIRVFDLVDLKRLGFGPFSTQLIREKKMSDSNPEFQTATPPAAAPPSASMPPASSAPVADAAPLAPRPTKLRPVAIALFVIGLIVAGLGAAKILPGGLATGGIYAFWGIMLYAFSYIRLPQVSDNQEPPMSGAEKLMGIFYEPARVFKNLRVHPHWLAAFLVVAIASAIYSFAFVQRLTPERIVEHTMEKLQESPIKPPPEAMDKIKEDNLQAAKQPVQRVQTVAKTFFGWFLFVSFLSTLYLVSILAFGGRINFWQALSATFYSFMPVILITKVVSLILLFIKAPEDVHPVLNADTLVQDNLGILFTPAAQPALFVLGSAIGVLSFYGLWLRAKGLMNAGTKVTSTAAWSVTILIFVLALILGMIFATLFSSFLS